MPDIAKERGLMALLRAEAGRPRGASAPLRRAPDWAASPFSRMGLDRAARALDGIGGLGWSVIGFVVGAVFWHFIGFWSFMAEVVLAGGPPGSAQRAGWPEPQFVVTDARTPQTASGGSSCTMLALDRRSGATRARPCEAAFPVLPEDPFQGREDRIAAARSSPP
jgi:hypothetical protein